MEFVFLQGLPCILVFNKTMLPKPAAYLISSLMVTGRLSSALFHINGENHCRVFFRKNMAFIHFDMG